MMVRHGYNICGVDKASLMHGLCRSFFAVGVVLCSLFLSLITYGDHGGYAKAQEIENPKSVPSASEMTKDAKPKAGPIQKNTMKNSGEDPGENSGENPKADKENSIVEIPTDDKTEPVEPSSDDKLSTTPTPGHARIDNNKYPPIMRDLSKLPFPVRRMRELILEAAMSGDIEKLRPLIGYGDDVTMLSLGEIEGDPIAVLKSLAGDKDGHEILAILVEVLESGFVHLDAGTEQDLYVWPYFFAWPLDKLTPRQRVELFRLVTYGDYQDMESFGAYIFYRLGITPRGRWRFFVAGD